jgi:hypothetical protein
MKLWRVAGVTEWQLQETLQLLSHVISGRHVPILTFSSIFFLTFISDSVLTN